MEDGHYQVRDFFTIAGRTELLQFELINDGAALGSAQCDSRFLCRSLYIFHHREFLKSQGFD